jgi:hypothetical protein
VLRALVDAGSPQKETAVRRLYVDLPETAGAKGIAPTSPSMA